MAFKGVDLQTQVVRCIARSFLQIMPMDENERRDLLDASIQVYDGEGADLKISGAPHTESTYSVRICSLSIFTSVFIFDFLVLYTIVFDCFPFFQVFCIYCMFSIFVLISVRLTAYSSTDEYFVIRTGTL